MHRTVLPFTLALLAFGPTAFSQTARPVDDPANLMGERTGPQALADTLPINHGAAALQQLLLKLRTRASLMMIVAHPDDEDGGLLTLESRGAGARVAMLTLTRGEGGQNLMSADFGDALGLLRTQELLAADRYMGVNQFFGTEIDFGFSKTKEEAFSQWTHERVLYDAVRAVRLYRPLVLASVFVGGPTDGHGHHQVSGEIAQEVFLAAADPKVFPEMGLPVWAPLKVFARVPFSRVTADGMYDYATGRTVPTHFHNYVTGSDSNAVPQATVDVHEGAMATANGRPALGMDGLSYLQFARKGLAMQKTQIGPGVRLAPAGAFDSGYTLMGSRLGCPSGTCTPSPAVESDLFAGIDTGLMGIGSLAPDAPPDVAATLAGMDGKLGEAQRLFDPENLELTAPPLRDALRALDTLIGTVESAIMSTDARFDLLHELRIKRVQLNDALAIAHHLSLTAKRVAPAEGSDLLTTAGSLTTRLRVVNQGANSMEIASTRLSVNLAGEGIGASNQGHLEPRTTRELDLRLPYLAGLAATRPYFTQTDAEEAVYTVSTPALRNAPLTPDPIVTFATLDDEGVRIELSATVPSGDPQGPIVQPLVVVPPVSIVPSRTVAIVPGGDQTVPLTAQLRLSSSTSERCTAQTHPEPATGKLFLQLPSGWTSTPDEQPFNPGCLAASAPTPFLLHPPADRSSGSTARVQLLAREGGHNYGDSFRAVGYPGLSYTYLYRPATLKAVSLDVQTPKDLKVVYVTGTGDAVPEFLAEIGVKPTLLTPADLTAAVLAPYDAVVLGVRAYAAHPELAGGGSRGLLDYARAGGVVIVQYNNGGYSGDAAPFPISVPGDPAHNVVVEAAPVELLEPANPMFTWPNHINPSDFNGRVEERGHGFAASWDPHFQPLLEVHDPEQDPQRGGLLYARTGSGVYLYVAFALYRQLPEGVPGAYRLLANLVSLRRNPGLADASNRTEANR